MTRFFHKHPVTKNLIFSPEINADNSANKNSNQLDNEAAQQGQTDEHQEGEDCAAGRSNRSQHGPRHQEDGDDREGDGEKCGDIARGREEFCGNTVGL